MIKQILFGLYSTYLLAQTPIDPMKPRIDANATYPFQFLGFVQEKLLEPIDFSDSQILFKARIEGIDNIIYNYKKDSVESFIRPGSVSQQNIRVAKAHINLYYNFTGKETPYQRKIKIINDQKKFYPL